MSQTHYDLVAQFQRVGNVVTTDTIKRLYTKLFYEEHQEFMVAYHDLLAKTSFLDLEILVEVLDGLADMRVIRLGSEYHQAPIAKYLKDIEDMSIKYLSETFFYFEVKANVFSLVDATFVDVMRSNMSKFCKTNEEADITIEYYASKGIKVFSTHFDSHYVIRSSHDQNVDGKDYPEGKILKSINYSAPDIKPIIQSLLSIAQAA